MKKPIAILLCLVMVMSMLSACGSSGSTAAPADSGTSGAAPAQSGSAASDPASAQGPEIVYVDADDSVYRVLYSSEVTTLNYLTSSNTNDQRIGANTVDTLVEYDSNGEIQPSLATEWTYDDEAQTWTFKLREGQKWVDTTGAPVADVTAGDFVAAMKYMLTPEMGSTTAQNLFGVILNVEEYYNGLAGEEDYKPIDFSEVGVRAEDDYTLVYTLETPVPYFLSMLTYVCFMPAYGPQLEELGASFATSADTMYYNGAYYVSAFEPQVQLVYIALPHSHHYKYATLALEAGKHVLCEKAFTVNADQARRLCALAREKKLLITEAIWTRYMPSRKMIDDIIASGVIGEVTSLTANLGYVLAHVKRIWDVNLAGGALLDVGVYVINFARMVFGEDMTDVKAVADFKDGVDAIDSPLRFRLKSALQ